MKLIIEMEDDVSGTVVEPSRAIAATHFVAQKIGEGWLHGKVRDLNGDWFAKWELNDS